MIKTFLIYLLLSFLLFCKPAESAPLFEIKTSTTSAEKGHTFQILFDIHTDEMLNNLTVSVIEPEGFFIEAIPSPSIDFVKQDNVEKKNTVHIKELGEQSSLTIIFKVWPPGLLGNPKMGSKSSLYSTREPKVFSINVLYETIQDGNKIQGSQTKRISIRYTTSIGHYLIAGLFGVFLGFMVKTATQYKNEISESLVNEDTIKNKLIVFFSRIFILRIPQLLTLLVIGFGVMLSLARVSIPVSSWHQAIAIGLGIGLLSDEQLITKVKKLSV